MTFIEDYESWLKSIKSDLDHVYSLLQLKLSDEPEKLVFDLESVEIWYSRMGYLLAEANDYLDRASNEFLPERTTSLGDTIPAFDRKIQLDGKIAIIRKYRDQIENLSDSIKQRLILGMSILSYQRQFKEQRSKNSDSPF